jgi:hypothetical protein
VRPDPISVSAAQLLRALVKRIALNMNRISIGRIRSVDWQSLTFTGERHEISLRLAGPDPHLALEALRVELRHAEWQLDGHIVAEILIVDEQVFDDGSITLEIEALTLCE